MNEMNVIIGRWNEYIKKYPHYRIGQALFNSLSESHPQIANELRGVKTLDPFYKDENINSCLGFVYQKVNSSC